MSDDGKSDDLVGLSEPLTALAKSSKNMHARTVTCVSHRCDTNILSFKKEWWQLLCQFKSWRTVAVSSLTRQSWFQLWRLPIAALRELSSLKRPKKQRRNHWVSCKRGTNSSWVLLICECYSLIQNFPRWHIPAYLGINVICSGPIGHHKHEGLVWNCFWGGVIWGVRWPSLLTFCLRIIGYHMIGIRQRVLTGVGYLLMKTQHGCRCRHVSSMMEVRLVGVRCCTWVCVIVRWTSHVRQRDHVICVREWWRSWRDHGCTCLHVWDWPKGGMAIDDDEKHAAQKCQRA